MGIFWVLFTYAILAALCFVVIGLFLGISQKTLRSTLLISLLLVLIRLLWVIAQGSMTVVWLCLFMAVVISARLMFFRAP